jgi:hypothetical protein
MKVFVDQLGFFFIYTEDHIPGAGQASKLLQQKIDAFFGTIHLRISH